MHEATAGELAAAQAARAALEMPEETPEADETPEGDGSAQAGNG